MNRVVSSRSGRVSYGQKWQNNIEGSIEIEERHSAASESGDGRHSASFESIEIAHEPGNTISTPTSGVVAAPPPSITGQPKGQDNENKTPKGRMTAISYDRSLMYQAAFKGDWPAAEILLKSDPSLACAEITGRGDRALHVATAVNRTKFVHKLIERMSPNDLALRDGLGQTACCYAAISGNREIADAMIKKNSELIIKRDINGATPLYKAALRGNAKMVSYFLQSINVEHLSRESWFQLLQVSVRSKMYVVALKLLEMDGSLATMMDEHEGTALHMLARLDLSDFSTSKEPTLLEICLGTDAALSCCPRKMQPDLKSLAEKLWGEIQRLEQPSVVEIIKKPSSILHDAAKVGNLELITMLTRTHPDLITDYGSNKHTIFHIAVIHRQENVFRLIDQIGAMKDSIAILPDENGNNILHLAGKLAPPETRKIVSQSALEMQSELAWFKEVEAIVPPSCLEMRNHDGYRPRELFSKEHKSLLEKSEQWMRETADSCMLIATIVLTVVFAAAFTPPGGNNSETGIPIFLKKTPTLFATFVISEGIALIGSIFSIMMFWSIMTSSFEEHQFLHILPYQLKWGLYGLLGSLTGAISAFMSAYILVFVGKRAGLVYSIAALTYLSLLSVICSKIINLWALIRSRRSRHKLFSDPQKIPNLC